MTAVSKSANKLKFQTGDTPTQSDFEDLIDSYQDVLVSGTNIKTINGNSLLGSGNLSISTGDEEYVEVANVAALPGTGSSDVLYVTMDTGFLYRWSGSAYVKIGGDDATSLGTVVSGSTAKTTPIDADIFSIFDSVASFITKKVTWANIKATLKTYFDSLYVEKLVTVESPDLSAVANYTLVLADSNKHKRLSKATAITLTVPKNATTALPVGFQILGIQAGDGQITVTPEDGTVTINSASSAYKSRIKYAVFSLVKVDTNTWDLGGDLTI